MNFWWNEKGKPTKKTKFYLTRNAKRLVAPGGVLPFLFFLLLLNGYVRFRVYVFFVTLHVSKHGIKVDIMLILH